jgi:tyrosine decarboxylase / aspartate 1-decarboxylase
MLLEKNGLELLDQALAKLEEGFSSLPEYAGTFDAQLIAAVLAEAATRMQDNFPYPHPLYAGQMLKPPHPVARLAYALSMYINPNNHALDGGRASSAMEKEAVANIAAMLGFKTHLGHLCSGGTMANLEALWIASKLHPDRLIVASQQAHYTHSRLCNVLGVPFAAVPTDSSARMSIEALQQVLKDGEVGTVVVTTGTTCTGSIDPLAGILKLRNQWGFRIHVDAAYGGYFKLAGNLDTHARAVFDLLDQADSLVIDPHKHGLQPYGCGCVLFKDPAVGTFYKHDSPYTYFSSDELHLGEISLECSRPGASAVALWATQRLLPMVPGGQFARDLEHCREAALALAARLSADPRFVVPIQPELDIVVWALAADTASGASAMARTIFKNAASQGLHLALADLPRALLVPGQDASYWDQEHVTCLRSCLMKPQHLNWLEQIWTILDGAATF